MRANASKPFHFPDRRSELLQLDEQPARGDGGKPTASACANENVHGLFVKRLPTPTAVRSGFVLRGFVPRLGRVNASVSVVVRDAEVTVAEDLAVFSPRASAKGTAFSGYVDPKDEGRVRGWAWTPERPDRICWVLILLNGIPVAHIKADRYRQDLEEAGIGDGSHSFSHGLDPKWIDGTETSLDVIFAENGLRLPGVPMIVKGTQINRGRPSRWRLSRSLLQSFRQQAS